MVTPEDIYPLFILSREISTDSRNIEANSIFFAMKGENFNGNEFAADALAKGARYAVIDDPYFKKNDNFLLVPDTIGTLQKLAVIHRRNIKAKIIGITGSNGKTTTKELTGRVLQSSFKTKITRGNFNNHIGVPLTLLSLDKDDEIAVVEMGANHPGEIASLCEIARPDFGIITNIGKAHLEGFGSFEGVIRAKSELYNYIRRNGGKIFVNLDNDLLAGLSEGIPRVCYGSMPGLFCSGQILEREPHLKISWHSGNTGDEIATNLYGQYNYENILASVCIGLHFGVSADAIRNAISSFTPENNRSQLILTGKNKLILDAYNANPSSMKASLSNFHQTDAISKMVILGDMMELGEEAGKEHHEIVELVRKLAFNKVVLVGKNFKAAAAGGKEICFDTIEEAMEWFNTNKILNMAILLKGSRKMQLEKLRNLF
jgi:UDP-N-acetylmuramoyl-tripeptide--D-alanyl-D-alanine ligase